MINTFALILLALLFIFLAGLFAGSETGMYRLSRLRLRLGVEKKKFSFIILAKNITDSPGLLLSILIATNLAHYTATSIVTLLLLNKLNTEHSAELIATVLVAPLLFVFAEMVPKSLFFYRADTMMPYSALLLFVFHKFCNFCGFVPALKKISGLVNKLSGFDKPTAATISAVHKPHISTILRETKEEDLLSPVQTEIINRMAATVQMSIKSVMIPISKVQAVSVTCDKNALLEILKKSAFTRLLVYDGSMTNISGFIDIYECLASHKRFSDLRDFLKPIQTLPVDTIVTDAINFMRQGNHKIVLVTKTIRSGIAKPAGIVTMKDLVEELLGELAEW